MSVLPLSTQQSYLIIGGGTAVGEQVVQQLLRRGETRVAIFDAQPLVPDVAERYGGSVRVFVGDILVPEGIAEALKSCEATCIIHTGMVMTRIAIEGRSISSSTPPSTPADDKKKSKELVEIHKKVNTEGMRHVLAAALEHGSAMQLVYVGNADVVFNGHERPMLREADATLPAKPWDDALEGHSHGERMVLSYNGMNELRTAVIRPAGAFGPGFSASVPLRRMHGNPRLAGVQVGENTNLTDRTFVANVAHAAILAADRLVSSHPQHAATAGRAFFITDGAPRPFWDFMRALWTATGGTVPPPTNVGRNTFLLIAGAQDMFAHLRGEKSNQWKRARFVCSTRTYDISLAREVLGYAPIVSHDEGIRRTAEWWLEQQLKACKEKRAITDTTAEDELPAYEREEVSLLTEKSPFF
ncbi:hypothetical protein C8R46DRAFT_1008975 [Mycena filopes]|nr:hypothetical protein C8R46DRAFT_1008975 [Mycena filopes]